MSAKIIDGKAIAAAVNEETRRRIEALKAAGKTPGLAVVLVGDDPASQVYVNSKAKKCAELGIFSDKRVLPADTTMEELLALIDELNHNPAIDGILVQSPPPPQIDEEAVIAAIDPDKDVDCFCERNVGRLLIGKEDGFRPCTPWGVMLLLERSGIESVYLDYKNYSDFLEILDFFCRLNGTTLKQNRRAETIEKEVDSICRKAKRLPSLRFAVLFAASRGFALERNGVNAAHMLTMLGGKNIITEPGNNRIPFSFERLLLEDPEIIFIITMGPTQKIQRKVAKELMEQPAWKQLSAVKRDRVHFLPLELYLYLPGTRFPEAFRRLAEQMHPGEEF